MFSENYIEIDKSIVNKGMIFDFNIFLASDIDKEIKRHIHKNYIVTDKDLIKIDEKAVVYISESDHQRFLHHIQKKNLDPTKSKNFTKDKISPLEFKEKSKVIYTNATKALNDLFNNPETLSNYDASKEVVNELVENVLDDDFTLMSLMSIAEHDYYTHTHSLNVAIYSMSLGSFLNLDSRSLAELGEAALLHDLGKSKICPSIINKNGKLDDKEWKKMMAHPSLGYTIGRKLGITNQKILNGIRHHHEKMDGSGYPHGLMGAQIPLYAKIIGLCDIFDALTSKRSYKEAMSTFEALKLIKYQMNNHVDLSLLNSMVLMFK